MASGHLLGMRVRALRAPTVRVKCNICIILCTRGDIYPVSMTKTRKVGGSIVVTIPKKLIESKKIKEGELVEISVKKVRIDGFGAFKGMKRFTAEDELKTHD